jgi:MFS family permease
LETREFIAELGELTMAADATTTTATDEKSIKKVTGIAVTVTTIEWYDFFLYGTAAAIVFPKVFFSENLPPMVALLAAFGTFSAGFLARPVGGAIFGHFGDRIGRKKALVAALVVMGVATMLIGCLPTYEMVGFWAPLALIFLRVVQGLAVGGQWGGAALLVTEACPQNQRGFYGSFVQIGAPAAVILSNLAFLAVSESTSQEAFMSWGWRIPFLASIILIGFAIYIEVYLEDTPAFREVQKQAQAKRAANPSGVEVTKEKSPVLVALKTYPKEILLAAGSVVAVPVTFYIIVTFTIAYAAMPDVNIPRNTILLAVLIGSAAVIPSFVIFGALSDRIGRRGIYMLGAVLLAIFGFFMFPLIDTGSFPLIVFAICMSYWLMAMMYGPQTALFAEMFSAKVRYSAISVGYQIGSIFGGALAPLIATALLATFKSTVAISVYTALACAVSFVSVYLMKDRHKIDIRQDD